MIGYRHLLGLGGWNCSHGFSPYFEGSPRTYSKEQLEDYKAKNYTYNGKAMTEYEALQEQRNIERNIRKWKREQVAMEAAGQSIDDTAVKLKAWQAREDDFLKQTGLKRASDRTSVCGYGKSQATKATNAAKRVEKSRNSDILKEKLDSGEIKLEINVGNQNKHLVDSHSYDASEGRSILYGDLDTAQKLVNQYSGTGDLKFTNKNEWTNKEFITVMEDVGEVYNKSTGEYVKTNRFAIHYGKKGTHVVPMERR